MTEPLQELQSDQHPHWPNARRQYFRVSEISHCDLRIAHDIRGSQRKFESGAPVAMWWGTALEPAVIEMLSHAGFQMAFVKSFETNEQLEVAFGDPYTTGHPDGLIWATEITDWMRRRLPGHAIEMLANGELFLLEVKTMGPDTWKAFVSKGLDGGGFLGGYRYQTRGYLKALNSDPEEAVTLWPDFRRNDGSFQFGYQSFKDVLNALGKEPPAAALIVGANTERRSEYGFAFHVEEQDDAWLETRIEELRSVSAYLQRDELPPPSFDGKAPECFLCPFSHVCPATQKVREETALDDLLSTIRVESPDQSVLTELDRLAMESFELSEVEREVKARRAEIREQLLMRLDGMPTTVTPNFRLRASSVRGRETIDMPALEEIADQYGFMIPKKRGAESSRLRIEALFGPSGEKGEE